MLHKIGLLEAKFLTKECLAVENEWRFKRRIEEVECCIMSCVLRKLDFAYVKTKAQISFAVTVQ